MTFEEWERKNRNRAKLKDFMQIVLAIGAVMFIVAICSTALSTALNTPEVEFSWETKQCVRVVYMDGRTTDCKVLPEKYDKVWVK